MAGHELGTEPWLRALQRRLNESDAYHRAAAGWRWPLGLGFLAEGDAPTRLARLSISAGHCEEISLVDQDEFDEIPFALRGPYSSWARVAEGGIEPMKAIVLKRIEFRGDTLVAMKYLPAAKELLACACELDTEIPA